MKKLSIEEKAKAYDEAIEVAREYWNSPRTCIDINVLPKLFPELKESEDERIRKDIVFYIAANHKDDGEKARWLYWLEKQSEQNPDTDFSDLRTWKYIVDAVWTEKEGIGQYLDSPFTEEVAKKLQKRFGNIEQNPAWSEEDERMLGKCIDAASGYYSPEDKQSMKDWLYLLKDRYTWKPSEEQIKAVKEAACYSSVFSEKTIDNLISLSKQLKKLKE